VRQLAPRTFCLFGFSSAGTLNLQEEILANAVVSDDADVADFKSKWYTLYSMPLPKFPFPSSAKQAVWGQTSRHRRQEPSFE